MAMRIGKLLFLLLLCFSYRSLGQVSAIEFTKEVQPYLQGRFLENKGQIIDQDGKVRSDVKYIYSISGFSIAFRENGLSYMFSKPEGDLVKVNRVDVSFGTTKPQIEAFGRSEAALSYNIAPRLNPGITNVHGYQKLVYKNVWPKIDLEFSINSSGYMKYNVVVHSGGDLADVHFSYGGLENLDITQKGLMVDANGDKLFETIPRSFLQEDNTPVMVSYKAEDKGTGFTCEYDRTKTLVIDPVVVWDSTATSGIYIADFCRDSKGNIYFTGSTTIATSYLVTSGAYQSTVKGTSDAFLVKIKPSREIIWGTLFGSSSSASDGASYVACNDSVVYIFGTSAASNGLATANAYQTTNGGGSSDIYLAKFSQSGSLDWSSYFGDTTLEKIYGVGCDRDGNAYFAGSCLWVTPNRDGHFGMMKVKFDREGKTITGGLYKGSNCERDYIAGFSMDKDGKPLVSSIAMCSDDLSGMGYTKVSASSSGGTYSSISDYASAGGIWGDSAGRVYWAGHPTKSGNSLYKLSNSLKSFAVVKEMTPGMTYTSGNTILSYNMTDLASDKWSNIYTVTNEGYIFKYDSASKVLWKIYASKILGSPKVLTGLADNFYVLGGGGKYVAEYNAISDLGLISYSGQNTCAGKHGSIRIKVTNVGEKAIGRTKLYVSLAGPDTLQFVDSSLLGTKLFDTTEVIFQIPFNLKAGSYKTTVYVEKNLSNEFAANDTLKWTYIVREVNAIIRHSDSSFCVGDTIVLQDSSYSKDSITAVGWTVDGNYVAGSTVKKTFTQPGVYTFQLTAKTPYCENTVEKKVYVNGFPVPNFSFKFSGNCPGTAIAFTNKTDSAQAQTVTYFWDFGDGKYSTLVNPTHSYEKGGSYKVTLTAKGAPHCGQSLSKTVFVKPAPLPKFTLKNTCEGEHVMFTDQSTIDSGYSISKYAWNFGDGVTSTIRDPDHKFASAGTYDVTLVVTSNSGCSDSITQQVVVHPRPQADFNAPDVCQANATQFSNKSTVSQGSIKSYYWVFGSDTSTQENPSYAFGSAGQHSVTLFIESAAGCRDSVTKSVTVYALPNASFSYSHSSNYVHFQPASSGQGAYSWDFGDGNTSTAENPSHLYIATGTYTVTLKVKNANGCEQIVTDTVVISTVGISEKQSENFHITVFPNPFTKATTLEYELKAPAKVEARLYDMQGREIAVIVEKGKQAAGKYSYEISADKLHLKAGSYLIRLVIDGQVRNEQVIKLQ